MREWLTAVKLERSYTKEEIMAMYLNKFEFINGAHGIQAASKVYFNKDQKTSILKKLPCWWACSKIPVCTTR